MGPSFGGLSSTYAAVKYSDYFSRFGCVSNAYYPIQSAIEDLIKKSDFSKVKKFYMDVGTKEENDEDAREKYIVSNQVIFEILSEKIVPEKLKFKVIKDAIHNESAWEKRFPEILKFLFKD